MAGGYSDETLANALARVQNRRRVLAGNNRRSPVASRDYRQDVDYHDYSPEKMDTVLASSAFAPQISEQQGKVSSQATAASGVQAQNKLDFEARAREAARLEQAKKDRVKAIKETIKTPDPIDYTGVQQAIQNATQQPVKGGGKHQDPGPAGTVGNQITAADYYGSSGSGAVPGTSPGSSYYTNTPKWLDPSAGLTTFQAGGHSWTLNASVANRFKNFINALVGTGYKIKVAGSYADRNQANGSGNPSLHSYGLAVDINPFAAGNSYNPGNAGVHHENLPPGISALARKYGLVWGGDWKNSKDYMHFSVPYKGLM